jgi:hypothetical protein
MAALNESDATRLAGFSEGLTSAALRVNRHRGPDARPGVYAVVYPFETEPVFLPEGTGGRFKGRDPNVPTAEFDGRWVSQSRLLYFGKAGAPGESGQLHDRITLLSRFGNGVKASHWGGRLLWQIDRSADLMVRWRPTPDEFPRRVEQRLIRAFVSRYCTLPFANLIT